MRKQLSKAGQMMGRKGGRARTPAKSEAARRNGQAGGRPAQDVDVAVSPRFRRLCDGLSREGLTAVTCALVARAARRKAGFEHDTDRIRAFARTALPALRKAGLDLDAGPLAEQLETANEDV